jgi:hypothetical protein
MTGPAFLSGGMNIAKNWDWVQGFIIEDETTAPIDLTDSTLTLMIRKFDTDHTALVTVTTDDGSIEITDAINGAFTIIITRDKLARLYVGQYVADLVRYRPDGFTERLWDASPVEVFEGVTRGVTQ